MELVLDVNIQGVKTKKFIDPDVITMNLLQKEIYGGIYMLVYTHKINFSS